MWHIHVQAFMRTYVIIYWQHIKKQRLHFADKGQYSQSYGFSSSHVRESWTIKKAECWRTDTFKLWCWRRFSQVPWTARISNVNPKGNQHWVFFGRADAEAGALILWPPDMKSWLIGKDPNSGKDRVQEQKGITEDEMVGWHHWFKGHEFKQTQRTVKDRETWRATVQRVGYN